DAHPRPTTAGESRPAKLVAALFVGALLGPVMLALLGAVWGGVERAAPCHQAPDFATGAFFGALVVTVEFWLPASIRGAIMGIVASGLYRLDRSTPAAPLANEQVRQ